MAKRLDLVLYAITEKKYSRGRSFKELMESCLKGGASVIQLRDKDASTRELVNKAIELRSLTRAYSALFIVNDRVDVTLVASADGVHLGTDDMEPALARKLLGPDKIIGKTVRSADEASEAELKGVDYISAGSIFKSETKNARVIGLKTLRDICRVTSLPVVAIGGIKLENVESIFDTGAIGVAVAKELLDFQDIEERARSFKAAIDELDSETAGKQK